jgi:hypothetical protein
MARNAGDGRSLVILFIGYAIVSGFIYLGVVP